VTDSIDPRWDFSGHRPFAELTAEEKLMELGRQIAFVKTWQGVGRSESPRQPPEGPAGGGVPKAPTGG
jgi:hypothetical protein